MSHHSAANRKIYENARAEIAALRKLAASPPDENLRQTLEGIARRLELALSLLEHTDGASPAGQ